MSDPSFALVASDAEESRDAIGRLRMRYPSVAPEQADIIVALGGDGFVLDTLHWYHARGVPI